MATQPAPGIPRHYGTPKPVTLERPAAPVRLRDTVSRADRQAVRSAERDHLSPLMRGILARQDDLEANVTALAARLNTLLEETAKNDAAISERVNGMLAALDNATSKLAKRVNELAMYGTLAQRPTAAGSARSYWATDQAAGSRLRFDDPTTATWIAP